jgi:hypothetical protein
VGQIGILPPPEKHSKKEEVNRPAVVAKNTTTSSDGKIHEVEYFKLDVAIPVGYRLNSNKETQFSIWAHGA